MSVCGCGRIMPKGSAWCQHCFIFWQSWWLRISDGESNRCKCEDCDYRKRMQPLVDEMERVNAQR